MIMINRYFRIFIIYYLCSEYASIAGKNHNQMMLWAGVVVAYIIIVRWFPPFQNTDPKKEEN